MYLVVAVGLVVLILIFVFGFFLYAKKYKLRWSSPFKACCRCCKCCLRAVGYSKVRNTLEDFENDAFRGSLEELRQRDYDNLFNFDGEEEVDFDPTDVEHLKLLESFRDTLLEEAGSDFLNDSATPRPTPKNDTSDVGDISEDIEGGGYESDGSNECNIADTDQRSSTKGDTDNNLNEESEAENSSSNSATIVQVESDGDHTSDIDNPSPKNEAVGGS